MQKQDDHQSPTPPDEEASILAAEEQIVRELIPAEHHEKAREWMQILDNLTEDDTPEERLDYKRRYMTQWSFAFSNLRPGAAEKVFYNKEDVVLVLSEVLLGVMYRDCICTDKELDVLIKNGHLQCGPTVYEPRTPGQLGLYRVHMNGQTYSVICSHVPDDPMEPIPEVLQEIEPGHFIGHRTCYPRIIPNDDMDKIYPTLMEGHAVSAQVVVDEDGDMRESFMRQHSSI